MQSDDGGVNLPRPYGEGYEFDDGLEDLIADRLNRMERGRRFWGRLANTWLWTLIRNFIPISAKNTTLILLLWNNILLTEKYLDSGCEK